MRPIKLTLQAFGSYGKAEVIDFTKTNQNLFLVTGDTGSGKTTIFDGIVFALYGEAGSSEKKDGIMLQSQYSGYDVVPTVTLEFSDGQGQGANVYTVTRSPRHRQALKKKSSKGNTYTEVSETVSLVMPDGIEYPQKEANAKIEEIVGLNKKQFMQVAMIAQGEFMTVLRQDTKEKKPIFRQLFKTELYDGIKLKLEERMKAAEKEVSIIKTECMSDAAKIQIPEGFIVTEEFERLFNAIKEGNITEADGFINEFNNLNNLINESLSGVQSTMKIKLEVLDRAKEEYSKIEDLSSYYQMKENNLRVIARCDSEKDAIEEKKVLSEKLRHSYEIKQVYDVVQALLKDYYEEKKKDEEERKKNPVLAGELEKYAAFESEKKLVYEEKAQNFHMIKEKVRKSKDILAKKKETIKEREKLALVVAENKRVLEKDIAERDKLDEIEKTAKLDIEETSSWEAKRKNLDYRASEYNAIKEMIEEYKKYDKDINALGQELTKKQQNYKDAYDAFIVASRYFEDQEKIYYDSQAGILARTLLPGFGCPVCGSTEHPKPCRIEGDFKVLERHELDSLKLDSEKKRETKDKLSNECHELKLKLENSEAGRKKTLESAFDRLAALVPVEAADISTIYAAFKDYREMLIKEKQEIDAEEEKYNKARKLLLGMEDKRKCAELIIENESETLNKNSLMLSQLEATIESYNGQTEYDSLEAATKAESEAGLMFADAEEQYKKAINLKEKIANDKIESDTLIAKYKEELPIKQERGNAKYQEYVSLLEKYELTEEGFKSLTHDYGRSKIDEWQKAINTHISEEDTARKMLAKAEELINGRPKPDIEIITDKVNIAKEAVRVEEEKANSLKSVLSINNVVYSSLCNRAATRIGKVRTAGKYRELYNMVAGKNTGRRMDLETFVLRTYLDRILVASNHRLYKMSAGQYDLRMVDIDKASEGGNKGLDLMVYSYVTGKQREIKTLSGGESFMAALSLALGMADQIQADTSAVNLDIMFVDEGFGSLDDTSRQEAVKVLKQMANGSKLIGIISHVSELKTEIDEQLVVTKDESGSHVKWING